VLASADDRLIAEVQIRRTLRDGDPGAIEELHRRVYVPEFGMNDEFVSRVRSGVDASVARGWPQAGGAVWLIERADQVDGCLALTDEGDGTGRVRWFVLEHSLRGLGLGRLLLSELLDTARAAGFHQLELETFSALSTAARLYRAAGFGLVWERQRDDWGPLISYQHYVLALGPPRN
jgi:GNAT superfamily N-acetyltransferase